MSNPRVVVIGGGIVGLAVAARAAQAGSRVTVLEKEPGWARHQTGHNSGVIHAGPYYAPGSLKARMCVAGNASMKRFAAEHGVPFETPGKLIVATDERELGRLDKLAERAAANGTPARFIDGDEAREYEPHVAAVRALRVESTGIIDYAQVSETLARLTSERGGELVLGTEVTGIRRDGSSTVVEHTSGTTVADLVINCAGLHSDRIARLAGLVPDVRIVPFRGEYYELVPEARDLVRGLIYPVPDPDLPFLGVHFTRMIDGSVHAGPNAVFAFAREGYRWRTIDVRQTASTLTYGGFLRLASRNVPTGASEIIRSLSPSVFARSLARLVPEVTRDLIQRAGAGVRAQAIRRDGSLADDFIIQHAEGQVHVLNAPSPAATSALEIANYICAEAGITRGE